MILSPWLRLFHTQAKVQTNKHVRREKKHEAFDIFGQIRKIDASESQEVNTIIEK